MELVYCCWHTSNPVWLGIQWSPTKVLWPDGVFVFVNVHESNTQSMKIWLWVWIFSWAACGMILSWHWAVAVSAASPQSLATSVDKCGSAVCCWACDSGLGVFSAFSAALFSPSCALLGHNFITSWRASFYDCAEHSMFWELMQNRQDYNRKTEGLCESSHVVMGRKLQKLPFIPVWGLGMGLRQCRLGDSLGLKWRKTRVAKWYLLNVPKRRM